MVNFNLIVYLMAAMLAGRLVLGCSVLDDLAGQLHHRSRRDTNKPFFYNNTDNWKNSFPADCGSKQQSPIDIHMDSCSFPDSNATTLRIIDWDVEPTTTLLKRTGKTVEFWNRYGVKRPLLTGGVLGNDIYGFYQFHFHWGVDRYEGAEHLIEGLQQPLEVHFVFINEKYKSLTDALHKRDGLAVLGRFYEVDCTAAPPIFAPYLEKLQTAQTVDAQKGISLAEISPDINFDYVSYKGSLTTPPCLEIVTWIVGINKNVQIQDESIGLFRKLSKEDHVFRSVQPMNGRKLTCCMA